MKGEYKAAQDEKQRVWQQLQDLRGRIRAEKNEKYSRGRVWGDNRCAFYCSFSDRAFCLVIVGPTETLTAAPT